MKQPWPRYGIWFRNEMDSEETTSDTPGPLVVAGYDFHPRVHSVELRSRSQRSSLDTAATPHARNIFMKQS